MVSLDPGAPNADTVAAFDFAVGPSGERTLFPPMGLVGVTDSGFVVGRSDLQRLDVYDPAGRHLGALTLPAWQPRDRTAVWAEHVEWFMDSGRIPGSRADREQTLREIEVDLPDAVPLFGSLRGLPGDRLLIGAYSGDSRRVSEYFVVDALGELVGTIVMPPRSRIVAVSRRRVAILRYDALEQESIEVYPWPLVGR